MAEQVYTCKPVEQCQRKGSSVCPIRNGYLCLLQ
jgi:hypothetical protein